MIGANADFIYQSSLASLSALLVNPEPAIGIDSGSIQLIATGASLTVSFEWSVDGTKFWPLTCFPNGGGAGVTSLAITTTSAIYLYNAPGARFIQVRNSTYVSGAVAASIVGSIAHLDASAAGAGGLTPVSIPLTTGTGIGGTIAVGGTPQVVAAANPLRAGGYIYNPVTSTQQGIAAAESLFVSEYGTANVNTSPEIKPGGIWQIQTTNAISLVAVTSAHAFDGEVR